LVLKEDEIWIYSQLERTGNADRLSWSQKCLCKVALKVRAPCFEVLIDKIFHLILELNFSSFYCWTLILAMPIVATLQNVFYPTFAVCIPIRFIKYLNLLFSAQYKTNYFNNTMSW